METKSWVNTLFLFSMLLLLLLGCKPGSMAIKGDNCKMNGNFEIIKNGLPVNWNYYTSETARDGGDFKIISDSSIFRAGKKSLNFQINSCSSIGGVYSPGFFKEFKVKPGDKYKVSIWVINKGCKFMVDLETGMKGNPGIIENLVNTQENFPQWKYFECDINIPSANDNLRFEVNILSPGTIWFDDVRIINATDRSEVSIYPYRGDEECK